MANGEHSLTCARSWRQRATTEGWSQQKTAQAICDCCGVTPLKAYRLANDWTAKQVVEKVQALCLRERLPAPHISIDLLNAWENQRSRPRAESQDLLARLYQANAILLGFATDYSGDERAKAAARVQPQSESEPRQQILDALDIADTVRFSTDRTLVACTVSEPQMEQLEGAVDQLRSIYVSAPPEAMLDHLIRQNAIVQQLAAARQPALIQLRLSRVIALLAALIADTYMKLGDVSRAHAWFSTAEIAADDTADPWLRALVAAQQAMLPYYWGRMDEVLRLALKALQHARGTRCSPVALAHAAEGRALARLGNEDGAKRALGEAAATLSKINPKDGFAFEFTEARYGLYASGTHAFLTDARSAMRVHDTALASQPPATAALDPSLISLDQAITLARSGDATAAAQVGQEALLRTPAEHRTPILYARAAEVSRALPPGRQPAIAGFRELLQIEGTPAAPWPTSLPMPGRR